MAKYHINPKTGNPSVCKATKKCPFGDFEKDHYASKDEARKAYEQKNALKDHGPYPAYDVWNASIPKELNDAIEHERLRQHTDEARREYLLAGWTYGRALADTDEPLTHDTLLHMAGLVEPDNRGKLRITPVTFANGGFASPPDAVPAGVAQLVRFWPGKDAELEDKQYWLKEFLIVHPFSDGNGRTAWVLQQYMMDSWDKPEKLWDFDF